MNTTSIFFSLLIVLFTILLLYWLHKLKPGIAGSRSQRMLPILRIDHVSIEGKLFGVWQTLYDGGVLDYKEMNPVRVLQKVSTKELRHEEY